MTEYFGPHWKAEIKGVAPSLIENKDIIDSFMLKAVELVNMKVISGPYTFYYEHEDPWECGCTSLLALADSHMTLHSFINDGWVFLDLFSCKPIDTETLDKFLIDTFKPSSYTTSIEMRGKNYNKKQAPFV